MVEIKGSVVLESLAIVRARLGARYQELLNLLDDETRPLFVEGNRSLTAVNWIPLASYTRFLEADVAVSDGGNEAALIARSEAIIERQLHGIYKVFVKMSRPESLIEKIAAIHGTYFRGVQIDKTIAPGRASIRYTGFQKEHRVIGLAIIGFYRKALQLCGAKDVKAEFAIPIEAEKEQAELAVTWS
jgi:hypothetical protein